jgi:hypothetical protein
MKLIMENWRKFLKEAAADVSLDTKLKNAIVGTEDPDDNGIFGDEGGAVGIKGVEDKLKEKGIEIPDDFDLQKFVSGIEGIDKHDDGDFIQIKRPDGTPAVSEEEVKEGIEIFLEAQDELLDEKKKRKGKKKKKKKGKKDACYHKVRARYSVWPSAYASGALVKCRKVGASNWGNKSKKKKKK